VVPVSEYEPFAYVQGCRIVGTGLDADHDLYCAFVAPDARAAYHEVALRWNKRDLGPVGGAHADVNLCGEGIETIHEIARAAWSPHLHSLADYHGLEDDEGVQAYVSDGPALVREALAVERCIEPLLRYWAHLRFWCQERRISCVRRTEESPARFHPPIREIFDGWITRHKRPQERDGILFAIECAEKDLAVRQHDVLLLTSFKCTLMTKSSDVPVATFVGWMPPVRPYVNDRIPVAGRVAGTPAGGGGASAGTRTFGSPPTGTSSNVT